MNTLIVNLFGGPGASKSTLAAHTFSLLKQYGKLNVELVTEYAKQLTWQNRSNDISCQPYIFGKQLNRMWHLLGKVDVIITDSPLLLGIVYADKTVWPESFLQSTVDIFRKFNNLNFFLNRVKPYNPIGRNQTEEESDTLSKTIEQTLLKLAIPYYKIDGDIKSADRIIFHIERSI